MHKMYFCMSAQNSRLDHLAVVQGCAVVIEAQQLEYGRRADAVVTMVRSGSFLQEHVMQVS